MCLNIHETALILLGASNLVAIELEGDTGPGVLTVTLHEAAGFPIPDQFQEALGSNPPVQHNMAKEAKPSCNISQDQILPYAMLEFDRSVALVKASSGTIQNPLWTADMGSSKFDVFNPSELRVRLYIENSDDSQENKDLFLGFVQIIPTFGKTETLSEEWFQFEGTGKIRITMKYTRKTTLEVGPLGYGDRIGYGGWGDISTALNQDTERLYAFKEIPKSHIIPWPEVSRNFLSQAKSPFITPILFLSQVRTTVCLFSPIVQGGHLFLYLQHAHHFNIKQSTFYAAEILCALESIHEAGINYNGPKPKNILLDSLGHIALCDFTLFSVEQENAERTTYLEIPAPEIISGKGLTNTAKWWTLGVLLYEMLTGLPPFYSTDVNETYRKILFESAQLPDSLSSAAKDMLAKLLTREPEQRLGAKGVSEIKAHPFFNGMDWEILVRRGYTPPFRPKHSVMRFKENRRRSMAELMEQFKFFDSPSSDPKTRSRAMHLCPRNLTENELIHQQCLQRIRHSLSKESHVTTLEDPDLTQESDKSPPTPNKFYMYPFAANEDIYSSSSESCPSVHSQTFIKDDEGWEVVENEGWELVWDSADQKFHFYNHFTKAKENIRNLHYQTKLIRNGSSNTYQLTRKSTHIPTLSNVPTQEAKHNTLEAILKARYNHLIPQLLQTYGMDLNIYIDWPKVTPLYYAVKQEDVQLAEIFLDAGADPNMKMTVQRAPLIRAVQKENEELTKLLVQRTDRVNCSLALGQAVRQQAIPIVKILLANGAKCEFEESDLLIIPPVETIWLGCTLGVKTRTPIDWFMPPLVYAVKLGNKDLVRLLLAHGADANVGYHKLARKRPLRRACGRPIQLAMELKHHDIVQLLLTYGADVCLAQPTKPSHSCSMISREEHLEETAALMEAAASRKGQKLSFLNDRHSRWSEAASSTR
jgi:serum/glucocorticoid-regulated kinase 2